MKLWKTLLVLAAIIELSNWVGMIPMDPWYRFVAAALWGAIVTKDKNY